MTMKWSRESILIILTAVMLLIGLFYYGNIYLLNPIKEDAKAVSEMVDTQQTLLDHYSPSEELLAEYEEKASEIENFLPIGDQANVALITLEELANQSNVEIQRVARNTAAESIENIPSEFVKNNYIVEVISTSPADLRSLIEQLISEERVWNISSFSYSKSGEENYSASFNFDLYYFLNTRASD